MDYKPHYRSGRQKRGSLDRVKGEGSREVDHIERRKVDHLVDAGGPRASSRSSRLFDKATAMLW
jgi:hypothetical protein